MPVHDLAYCFFGALVQFELENIDRLRRADVCVDAAFIGAGFGLDAVSEQQEGDEEDGLVVVFVPPADVVRDAGEVGFRVPMKDSRSSRRMVSVSLKTMDDMAASLYPL